ncbi:hypothetical protein BOTBODRAFT_107483, partial [Botryobasidium botryosum FD-172 SS1]
ICAALFSRGDGQTFHWAFMIIKDDNIAHKMHVVQHMGAWSYQSGPHSFRVSQTLVVLVKIGRKILNHRSLQAGFNTIAYIDGLLAEKIPVNRGSGHFTCRTWFMAAIRGLDDEGHIFISSISGLENELRERAIAVERTRGRRVYAISTCSY